MAISPDDSDDPSDDKHTDGFSEAPARFHAGDSAATSLLVQLAETVKSVKDRAVLQRALSRLAHETANTGPIALGVNRTHSSVRPIVALLDVDLNLRNAAPNTQEFFGATLGDALSARIQDHQSALERLRSQGDTVLVNFSAADGRLYPAALRRLSDKEEAPQYRLAVHRLQLSDAMKAALKQHYRLSASEMSVIEGIIDRRTAQEIAIERDVQKSTVTSQIHNIVKKLASDSITDATLQIASLITADPEDLPSPVHETPLATGDKIVELKAAGASIHYRKMGETGGAPVLILHGLFDAAPPPARFARDLVRRGYCPYFIYRPGFARSTPLESDNDIAAAIDSFAQRVLTAPAILIGLHEAQDLAARLVSEPGSLGGRGRRGGGLRGAVIAGVEDWTHDLAALAAGLVSPSPDNDGATQRLKDQPEGLENPNNQEIDALTPHVLAILVSRAIDRADPSVAVSTVYGRSRFDDDGLLRIASDGLARAPAAKHIMQDLTRGAVDNREGVPSAGAPPSRRKATRDNIIRLAALKHRLALYADPTALIDALDVMGER